VWKATKASLLAHRLRLVLTALAVSAGVGFVSGTLVLTDTLASTFDTLFAEVSANKSLIVTGLPASGNPDDGAVPVPDSVVAKVRSVPGVAEARGDVFTPFAQLIGPDGEKVSATPGAPSVGTSHQDGPLSTTSIAEGRAPKGPDEVAIDRGTATRAKLSPGDHVRVITPASNREYTVSGTMRFGSNDNLAGATQVAWDLPTAQAALGRPGQVDEVDVLAAKGTSEEALRVSVEKALGAGFRVRTGAEAAGEQADQIKEGLSFINYFLGGFAVIALLVGSFIIVNTFSILVAQRTRELALFRALGASRRQVLGSVLAEAAATGVVGSIIGVVGGIALAFVLLSVFSQVGFGPSVDLPSVRGRTVAVGLGVGLVVTVLAAIVPAFRASRVPPVAAMSAAPVARSSPLVVGIATRILLVVAGVAVLYTGSGFLLLALGALLVFVGLVLLLSLFASPLAGLVGIPLRAIGIVGELGQKNATRNPRRTASTAAALMVGLALVGGAATVQASANRSIGKLVDGSIQADYVAEGSFSGINPQLADGLNGKPGIAGVAAIGFTRVRVGEGRRTFTTLTAEHADLVTFRFVSGSLDALKTPETILVAEEEAKAKKLKLGDTIVAAFPTSERTLHVGGIYELNQLAGSYVVSEQLYRATTPEPFAAIVLIRAAKGQEAAAQESIRATLAADPSAKVQTRAKFIEERKARTAVLLYIILVLLVLSVLIAVLGVINTLALSVYERIRELGLLRAVGTRRGQIAGMVFVESILVALIGGVLGLGFGVAIGAAIVKALRSQGLTDFVIPYVTVVFGVVFSMGAGVLAALFPSFRATRLNILDSIAVD
jgi:putative ABC transport system permease protein